MKRQYNYINGNVKRIEVLKILEEKSKNNNDIKDLISKCKENNFRSTQTLYHVLKNDFNLEIGLCKNCKTKRCTFKGDHKGYVDYCSIKCAKEATREEYLKKYGCFPFQRKEIQEKVVQSLLKKYNITNIRFHPDLKLFKKIKANKRYGEGIDNANQLPENKEKIKNAFLKKYGVPTPLLFLESIAKKEEKQKEYFIKRKFINIEEVTDHEREIIELIEDKTWWEKMLFELELTPKEISEYTGLKMVIITNKIKEFGLNNKETENVEYKPAKYDEDLFKPF